VVLDLEVLEHVFPVQMRMEVHSRMTKVVPLEQAAALVAVSRMGMAREAMPPAKMEDLLMEVAKTMHPAMETHSRQMVPTVETPLEIATHRREMVQPQLGQREPQAMLGKGEVTQLPEGATTQTALPEVLLLPTQILAQEMEMDKQTKIRLIKMALTEPRQARTEETMAPGHQLRFVSQPVLATLSVSTTNALPFKTRHLAAQPPAVSCVCFGDKRHQPASQDLLALTMSAYRPTAPSTAAHQVSIVPSTMLVSKTLAWLLVTQLLAEVKLAAAMKYVLAASVRQVQV
jgi:hypothetical protein